MNTLNLIKKQIEKAAATHDAQINITKYRGVDCVVHQAPEETHSLLGAITNHWDRGLLLTSSETRVK